MVRGIADFGFITVPERIGVVWIFPVDVGDGTHMTIDPRNIAAARMTRIDKSGACRRITVGGIRKQCRVCSLFRPSGPNHIDRRNGFGGVADPAAQLSVCS